MIDRRRSFNVHLANEDSTAHSDGEEEDRKIHTRKLPHANVNVLPGKRLPPLEPTERCAECYTERAKVDTDCQAVYRAPERSVADQVFVILRPCLQYPSQEKGGPEICAAKLKMITTML
jgi:hypothetical protein